MSVLGYNSIGASHQGGVPNLAGACKFTAPEDGLITSMLVYYYTGQAAYGCKLALYSDNAGVPGVLLASGVGTVPASFPGWTDPIAISYAIVAGTVYWLVCKLQNSTPQPDDVYDAGSTGQYKEWSETYAAAWTNNPTISWTGARKISIYANYNAGPPLAAGVATLGTVAYNSVAATATDPSGGSQPYSHQWQRSPRDAGTYVNVTGQTTASLTDTTVVPGTEYDYRDAQTDSAATTVYTNVIQADVPMPNQYVSLSLRDSGDNEVASATIT